MLRVRSSLRIYLLISGIFKCTEHSKTLWRWTLMCSFVSALLSPEASGQQILHKRETEPLIAILMWLVHRRQAHSTEPSQILKIKLEKKALSTQKMLHKIPSTSAGFALVTAGAHTAVTIMSSVFHWSGTSSCGQQDKLWLSGRNPQERAEFYEVQLLWMSWRSSSVTNTAKPPKAPISNFYD